MDWALLLVDMLGSGGRSGGCFMVGFGCLRCCICFGEGFVHEVGLYLGLFTFFGLCVGVDCFLLRDGCA
jgi:hypothetical protein